MKKFVKETGKKLATGALALLATIGSVGAAELHPTNGENFSLSGTSTSSSDTANIPVYGYQTAKVYSYALNMTWGDMKFVFDRGYYDPTENVLTKKFKTEPWCYCDASTETDGYYDATAETGAKGVGHWCGFDGVNNRVQINNQGNGNVALGVSCTESSASAAPMSSQGVDLRLAVREDDYVAASASASSDSDSWYFSDGATVLDRSMMTDGMTPDDMKVATGSGTLATTVIQRQFNLDGTPVSAEGDNDVATYVEFWIDINGEPTLGDNASNLDVSSATPDLTSSTPWENIGTINLTFTPAEDTPRAIPHA